MELGEKIGAGKTAEVFRLRSNEHLIVKYFYPHVAKELIEREWAAARHVSTSQLPVPHARKKLVWNGRNAIIYDYVEGTSALQELLNEPGTYRKIGQMLATLHAQIHKKTGVGLPPQKMYLIKQMRQASYLDRDVQEAVIQQLDHLPDGSFTCHGDLHPDNILLTLRGPVILDWMNAHCGHPAADVARSWIMLRTGSLPAFLPEEIRSAIQALQVSLSDHYLQSYLTQTSQPLDTIMAWVRPVAAARLAEDLPDTEIEQLLRMVGQRHEVSDC